MEKDYKISNYFQKLKLIIVNIQDTSQCIQKEDEALPHPQKFKPTTI